MLKKILLAVAIALPLFASAQTLTIGIVDTNTIGQAMPEWATAQQKLQENDNKYKQEGQRLVQAYQKLVEEAQNMKPDELQAVKDRKIREVQEMEQKIQAYSQQADQDLSRMQQELMTPIMQKIKAAIESVAQENNISLVQETQVAIYFQAPVKDITPLVKAKLGLK